MKHIQTHSYQATQYTIRTEMHQGRKHIVVPVVMMVEGVHDGSRGPIFHSINELGKIPDSWNGIPITIDHPAEGESFISANSPGQIEKAVGRVYNTYVDGTKLKGEAWLDEAKLIAMSPLALAHIRQGLPLEVSVGVFSDEMAMAGDWNGEEYEAVAANHRPDHLALLPGGVGACSWQDGCGIRVNKCNDVVLTNKEGGTDVTEIIIHDRMGVHSIANYESYQERMSNIRKKLEELSTNNSYHYLADVYDDYFIYEKEQEGQPLQLFRQNYAVADNAGIEFMGDPVKVKREVKYLVTNEEGTMVRTKINNNTNKGGQIMSETKTPCFIKKVNDVIAHEATRFTEDDRDVLMAMEETVLDKLQPVETTPKTPPVTDINSNQAREALAGTLEKTEDVLPLLVPELQDRVKAGLQLHEDHRTALINKIQANAVKDTWEESELKGMKTAMLEKILKSIPSQADYSAINNNTHSSTQDSEIMLPMGIEVEK